MTDARGNGRSWSGVFTALVTPFDETGSVDRTAVRRLVRRQLEAGVAGVVAGATTGEGVTLEPDEQEELVEVVVAEVEEQDSGAAVLAGISVSGTADAARRARRLRRAGADALLVAAPGYNRPTQNGLALHFRSVADEGELPVMLYNVPSRTAVNLAPVTVLELASDPRFVGVKEASGDLNAAAEILRGRPPGFSVLSGEDSLALPVVALGGDGVVAVISNEVPEATVELVRAATAGERERAAGLHARLLPLMRANFLETNPIPVKWAVQEMGLASGRLRPPLTPLSECHHAELGAALEEALA